MNNKATTIFMAYTVVFVIVAGCLSIHSENMRTRWLIDPFILILSAIVITHLTCRFRAHTKENHNARTNSNRQK